MCLLCAVVLPSCSGSASGAARTAATPRVAATAIIPAHPFPSSNTPYTALSPALKRVWADYTLTLVPGQAVVQNLPAAPRVRDMTGGRIPQDVAQAWAESLMLRQRLVQWGLAHRQWSFLDFLHEPTSQEDSPWYAAWQSDTAVSMPDCAAYPTGLALWWTDDVRDPVVVLEHESWYFSEEFSGPCSMTAPGPGGTTQTIAFGAHLVQLVDGQDDQDAVFGDIWRGYTVACDASLPDHAAQCQR